MKKFRKILYACTGLLLLWFFIGFAGAWFVTRSHPKNFEDITKLAGRQVESVKFRTSGQLTISAWFAEADSSGKAVILLAGIGGNRTSSVSRGEFYLNQGYTVLLPDLRASGKSEGSTVSFGWHEALDLIAAYRFLKERGYKKIGVHGCSLGAATILYSLAHKPDYEFMVLESCYDNLETAFQNRVKKLHLPDLAYAPLRFWIEKIADIRINTMKPEEYITRCKAPVLIIAGDSEAQIKTEETVKLYQNCGAAYKELHFIKGGKHEDFMRKHRVELEEILHSFLQKL
ncbi:MAG: alpha/beta hydrolase [Cytophagaceae bacterium]